jgi:lycopene elongase/hydratase (dihydrobisanhydrobacterioruberin-forming)
MAQNTSRALRLLFTNHSDAWGMTFVILSLFFIIHDTITVKNITLMLSITAMYWLGFAVNDYYDVRYDALDVTKAQRNAFMLQPTIKPMFKLLAAIVMFGAFTGFAQYGWQGVLLFTFSLLILWTYSAPPLRLKSRPIFDLVTHTLFVETYPYSLCLLLIEMQPLMLDAVMLTFFALSSLGAQLEQQIRDVDSDARLERTFTTVYGAHISSTLLKIASAGLFAVGLIGLFVRIIPLWMLPFLVIGTPAVLHRFFRATDAPRPERLIRITLIGAMTYTLLLWLFFAAN